MAALTAARDVAFDIPSDGQLTGYWIRSLISAAGMTAGDVDAGQTQTSYFYSDPAPALRLIREMEETEVIGWVYEGGHMPGVADVVFGHRMDYIDHDLINYADRHRRLSAAASTTSQATFSDDPAGAINFWELEESDPLAEIYNQVMAEVQNYTAQAGATLWTLTGETPTLSAGEARRFIATYPTGASGAAPCSSR